MDKGLSASLDLDIDRSKKRWLQLWLAQGRWNEKEHVYVYISSNVSFGFAFATDVGLVRLVWCTKFWLIHRSSLSTRNSTIRSRLWFTSIYLQSLLQSLGNLLLGLHCANLSSTIWPETLTSTAMFQNAHIGKQAGIWLEFMKVEIFPTNLDWFFCWYFLPGLLMPALSYYFSVITWFALIILPLQTWFVERLLPTASSNWRS